jgi:hypothetical protein
MTVKKYRVERENWIPKIERIIYNSLGGHESFEIWLNKCSSPQYI